MSETPRGTETTDGGPGDGATAAPATPRRGPHRGTDPREAIAELTVRAHEISQDAGNKMAGAMRDVINAAAGLAGFAVESARDLIQYMVRRGQMSPQEGEKLLRQAEEAAARHPRATTEPPRVDRRSAGNGAPPQKDSQAAPKAAGPKATGPKATGPKATGPKADAKEAAPKESARATKAPAKSVAQKSASKSTAKVSAAGGATKATSKPASKSPARSAGGGAKAPAKTAASRSGARAASKSAPAKAAAKKAPAKKSAKKPAPAAGTKKKTVTGKTAARKGGKRK